MQIDADNTQINADECLDVDGVIAREWVGVSMLICRANHCTAH